MRTLHHECENRADTDEIDCCHICFHIYVRKKKWTRKRQKQNESRYCRTNRIWCQKTLFRFHFCQKVAISILQNSISISVSIFPFRFCFSTKKSETFRSIFIPSVDHMWLYFLDAKWVLSRLFYLLNVGLNGMCVFNKNMCIASPAPLDQLT